MFANTQLSMKSNAPKPAAPAQEPAREKDEQDLQGNAAVQGKVTDVAMQQAAGTPTLDMVGPMGTPVSASVTPNPAPVPIPYPNMATAAQAGEKKKGREN